MNDTPFIGRVACIGEAMAELMLGNDDKHPVSLGFAGDTLNSAVYLNRLLSKRAEVAFVSVLGLDPLSARMMSFMESEDINTEHVQRSKDRLIGLYAIATDDAGERSFSYWRSESAARTLFQDIEDVNFTPLAGFDTLCLSAITLAILPSTVRTLLIKELARLRTECGVSVVFDSNYRPALWESMDQAQHYVSEAWRITDIALPSVDDEMQLFNDPDEQSVLSRLKSYGIKRGALKRGALGPLSLAAHDNENKALTLENLNETQAKIVDTTAAGDSFNAGYLSAALNGATDQEAMLAGHQCSLRVIAHAGAIIPKHQW